MVNKDPFDVVLALGVEEADAVAAFADGDVDAAVPRLGVLVVAVLRLREREGENERERESRSVRGGKRYFERASENRKPRLAFFRFRFRFRRRSKSRKNEARSSTFRCFFPRSNFANAIKTSNVLRTRRRG